MSNSVYPGCTMSEYWLGRQESDDCEEHEETTRMILTVTKVVSKEGRDIDPEDGFIVRGCIFAAQVDDTLKSPMWWAMKLARGENRVMSLPRSFIRRNWLLSMVSRSSSSLIFKSDTRGMLAGFLMPAIWALRQFSSALGAVV